MPKSIQSQFGNNCAQNSVRDIYGPRTASLEIRALVVVGVRNSLIEDLGGSRSLCADLALTRAVLQDEDMPIITKAAIRLTHNYYLSPALSPDASSPTPIPLRFRIA